MNRKDLPAYKRVRTYLIVAFVVFMTSSFICMLIRPDLFEHPDYGLSFFGSIKKTIVPYMLGLLTVVYCLWSISKEIKHAKHARPLHLGFVVGAGCLLGITLTPMALHPIVWWTHIAISVVLEISMISVVVWILLQKEATWIDYIIGALFFVAGVATFLSGTWPGILGVAALGELVVFATSILLLGRAALHVVSLPPKAQQA